MPTPSHRRPEARPDARSSARTTAMLLAVAALVVGWSIHFWPHLHTANESIRLYFTQALVENGSPILDPICARHGAIPVDRSEFDGHILMDKAPGLSLLAAPLYAVLRVVWPPIGRQDFWLLGYLATMFCVLLPLCAGLWQLRRWILAHGAAESTAGLTLLCLLLASPLMIYGGLFFGHGLAAGLIAIAFFGLASADDDAPSVARSAVAGGAAGYAGLVDTPVFLLAAMLCLYAIFRRRGSLLRQVVSALPFIAGVAAAAVAQLGYNAWVLGDPFKFTYQFKGDAALAAIHAEGLMGFGVPSAEALWGLWWGSARGLFYHAPWLLVAAWGLLSTARSGNGTSERARRDARWLLAIVAGYALIVAGFVDWKAGDAAGARHLVPIVALLGAGLPLALPIADRVVHPRLRSALRAGFAALVSAGVLMHLPTVAGFPYHFDRIEYPVFELAWPVVTIFSAHSPSLGGLLGLPGPVSFMLQSAVLGLAFALWSRAAIADGGLAHDDAPGIGRSRAFGLYVTFMLLWLSAMVAPITRPGRAVQAAKYQAISLLGQGLSTRARLGDDPEGSLERKLPARTPKLTIREKMARRAERRALRARARAEASGVPQPLPAAATATR